MAGYASGKSGAGRKDAVDAEGRRIGAELGLGDCEGTWKWSQAKRRVVFGWIAIIFGGGGTIGGILSINQPGASLQEVLQGFTPVIGLLGLGVVLVAIPERVRRVWLFQYEGGVAQVTDRRRVSVVRWADLASMSMTILRGYDEEYVGSWALRDHAGNVVGMDKHIDQDAYNKIFNRAEQVLTGRLLGSLTDRLDAGLPVTVGCLTMDRSGIECQPSHAGAGRWHVSWQEVSGISTEWRGHRVNVQTGYRGSKRAALFGQPNGFLAGYVLEHAARQASVPFSTH